ncbi:MAG: CBS domain-containing protein [Nitrospinae bacterium]|nr:CBS domain-containing protein [Nitrospinota bacterium]
MANGEIGNVSVKSMMTRPVATVSRKTTVKAAVNKMAKKNLSCIVIAEKKFPIGIFTKFDLLVFLNSGGDFGSTAIETVMHTPVMSIEETDNIFSAAEQMKNLRVRRFIVVDAGHRLSGIVTNGDVIRAFAQRALDNSRTLSTLVQPGIVATPKTPLKKIVKMMVENRASCVVILRNGKPVGIVTDVVIARLADKSRKPLAGRAETKMLKKFGKAADSALLRDTIVNMVKMKTREIVVTSADGRYVGFISQRDVVSLIEANPA